MAQRLCPEWMLRAMLVAPDFIKMDAAPGRFLVEAVAHGSRWHVVLEPDDVEKVIIVVTVYPVETL